MAKTSLIIDCDPGVDDAVALLMALASPELDVIAITTVAGNVGADRTARNACVLRDIAGRPEVPVYAGAPVPLVRVPIEADHFHGESGLGDFKIPKPSAPPAKKIAAQAIVDEVMNRPKKSVSLAITGPMTNVAIAMSLQPEIIARIDKIAIMGGARIEGGNVTASAEYNIYADPHAAQIVLRSGCDMVLFGLDATHQVRAGDEWQASLGVSAPERAAHSFVAFSRRAEQKHVGEPDAPMHDSCPIVWLIAPALFTTVPAKVSVEIDSPLTLGHTAVEFRDADNSKTLWATHADCDGVLEVIRERLAPRSGS